MINSNDSDKSYRKPYLDKMDNHWWCKSRYYLFYIMRESTSFFMLWISIVLMYGVICTHIDETGRDEFYRFIFFLQHPVVVVINSLALISALFHTATWFNLMPKATNFIVSARKVPAYPLVIALWLITIVISALILLFVFGYFN